MKIVLPWPDARLSPNARVHHQVLAAAKKQARKDGAYATLEAMHGRIGATRAHFAGDFGIPMRILFVPPDKRLRDADNALASMKAYLDGIADALAVNDERFRPSIEMCAPERPCCVEVLV